MPYVREENFHNFDVVNHGIRRQQDNGPEPSIQLLLHAVTDFKILEADFRPDEYINQLAVQIEALFDYRLIVVCLAQCK